MTDISKKGLESTDKAQEYRREGRYVNAGEWYTKSAYTDLAYGLPGKSTGGELRRLLEAAICYRIGGRLDRCRNRCRMGILRAEDLRDRVLSDPPPEYGPHHAERAGWDESIGDFRIVGQLEGIDEAYEAAEEIYREAGDPLVNYVETPHFSLNAVFKSVAEGSGYDQDELKDRYENTTCIEWANFKRDQFPNFVETLVEQGEWPIPEPPDIDDLG